MTVSPTATRCHATLTPSAPVSVAREFQLSSHHRDLVSHHVYGAGLRGGPGGLNRDRRPWWRCVARPTTMRDTLAAVATRFNCCPMFASWTMCRAAERDARRRGRGAPLASPTLFPLLQLEIPHAPPPLAAVSRYIACGTCRTMSVSCMVASGGGAPAL